MTGTSPCPLYLLAVYRDIQRIVMALAPLINFPSLHRKTVNKITYSHVRTTSEKGSHLLRKTSPLTAPHPQSLDEPTVTLCH